LEKYDNIPLHYKYISGELTYQYDTRDIYVDPTSGTKTTLSLQPKLSFGQSENFYRFWFQYLKYFKISDGYLNPVLSFDTRFFFQQSKSFPIFAYQYLGGEDFVRGYSPIPEKNSSEVTNLIEGYNVVYHSVQLQHTLFEKEEFDLIKFGLELGIDMIYFVDMGIISDELISFKLKNTIVGYGFGFRFFASGAGVIEIDFGFNPYGQQFYHLSDSY
jgi:outer membrane protein assembly factor BamA